MGTVHLQRGGQVWVAGEWYPIIGYSLSHKPNSPTTGYVFTDKPYGRHEPWLGYRINYADIEQIREPE